MSPPKHIKELLILSVSSAEDLLASLVNLRDTENTIKLSMTVLMDKICEIDSMREFFESELSNVR